jgi:hypothetical protein
MEEAGENQDIRKGLGGLSDYNERQGKLAFVSKHRLVPKFLEIKTVPEKCKPTQCPFYIGNMFKPY